MLSIDTRYYTHYFVLLFIHSIGKYEMKKKQTCVIRTFKRNQIMIS